MKFLLTNNKTQIVIGYSGIISLAYKKKDFEHMNHYKSIHKIIFTLLVTLIASSCGIQNNEPNNHNHANENSHSHEENDSHEESRSPNNGSTVILISPIEGQIFESGEHITIAIEVNNFELSVNEGHWHLYIDGESEGMVTHGKTEVIIKELPEGKHTISAFLTQFTHVELEKGATVTITVNP